MIIKVPTKFGIYYVEAIRFTKQRMLVRFLANPFILDILMLFVIILIIGLF